MKSTVASKPRINSLQAGRALAAFGVLVFHASLSVSARVGEMAEPVTEILRLSTYRIDFFFVLSGFIIYLTTQGRGLAGMAAAYHFLRKRAVRIYPIYWILTVMLMFRLLNDPAFSFHDAVWHWFPTLTLMPYPEPTALRVAWTLQIEIMFYAIFALGILMNHLRWLLIGWAIMLLAVLFSGIDIPKGYSVFTAYYNLEFCIGIVTAYLYVTRPAWPKWAYLLVAAACMLSFWFIEHRLMMALCFAPLMLLLAHMEREGQFTVPRWLVYLGDSSFSLYLSHAIVIHLFSRAAALLTDNSHLALVGVCAGCYAFALIFYEAVEKPLIRWTR